MARNMARLEIVELWDPHEAGETGAQLARRFNMAPASVNARIVKAGGIRPTIPPPAERHLSIEEREEISRGLAAGDSIRAIAVQLGRAPSTVSREVRADVELDRARLTVAHTVTEVRGQKIDQDHGKSDAAERSLALDGRTVAALRRWKLRQAEERLAWPGEGPDTDLVFTREDGEGHRPKRLSSTFTETVDRLGLQRIGLHGLRHSYATAALRAGVSPEVLAKRFGSWMGHGGPDDTTPGSRAGGRVRCCVISQVVLAAKCAREDLNLHPLARTRPSTVRVCLFRHSRASVSVLTAAEERSHHADVRPSRAQPVRTRTAARSTLPKGSRINPSTSEATRRSSR